MNSQNFEQARQYALRRLQGELSPTLYYHGLWHTQDDVVPAAGELAVLQGLPEQELYLVRTAAWFHDVGYIEQAKGHEMVSVRIAGEVLPGFGYAPGEVEIIQKAILATIVPQSPSTLIEKILADADMNTMGRPNFMARGDDLRREQAVSGRVYTDAEWYASQLRFVKKHAFFTAAAQALLGEQKLKNIAGLEQLLNTLAPTS